MMAKQPGAVHSRKPQSLRGNARKIRTLKSTRCFWAQIVVTIPVLACCLKVILSNHCDGDAHEWAYGVVGTILGIWAIKR